MSQGLPVRLRVMVPAVENAIDGGYPVTFTCSQKSGWFPDNFTRYVFRNQVCLHLPRVKWFLRAHALHTVIIPTGSWSFQVVLS